MHRRDRLEESKRSISLNENMLCSFHRRQFYQPCRGCTRRVTSADVGMTLIELLIVLALLLVSMGAVIPNLMRVYQRDSVSRVINSVSSVIGQARTLAIDSSSVHLVRCYPDESNYDVTKLGVLGDGLASHSSQYESTSAVCVMRGALMENYRFVASDYLSRGSKGCIKIYCLPDGTSTAQEFGLKSQQGDHYWLRVDALTGELSRQKVNASSNRRGS